MKPEIRHRLGDLAWETVTAATVTAVTTFIANWINRWFTGRDR